MAGEAVVRRYNVDEAAERLGISKHTARALIRRRAFAVLRVGRRIVIDAEDLAAYERSCRVEARAGAAR